MMKRRGAVVQVAASGYGRETKRPAIGYGQRPENRQRADGWAEVWADGWAEGEGGLAGGV